MNQLQIFLPCAAGVEDYLCGEVQTITDLPAQSIQRWRGGVMLQVPKRACPGVVDAPDVAVACHLFPKSF